MITSNRLYKIDLSGPQCPTGSHKIYLYLHRKEMEPNAKVFLQEMFQILPLEETSERNTHPSSPFSVNTSTRYSASIMEALEEWNFNSLQANKLFGLFVFDAISCTQKEHLL